MLDDILAARDAVYGSFLQNATIAQQLKAVLRSAPGWGNLAPDMQQAMDVTMDKYSRMLGAESKPDHIDSWIDCAGYHMLVAERLRNG